MNPYKKGVCGVFQGQPQHPPQNTGKSSVEENLSHVHREVHGLVLSLKDYDFTLPLWKALSLLKESLKPQLQKRRVIL